MKEINLDHNNGDEIKSNNVEATEQNIHESIGDISKVLTPNMSNEDILDAIISADQSQLLPWEDCRMPSDGLYYGWPDGIVQVKPMGQTAEKILATSRLAQSGQSLDYLFNECVKFPLGFKAEDLLLGDRIFLLYYIRGITHGNIYEFAVNCPREECGHLSTHKYDLNELARTIVFSNPSNGREPFKIELPYLSKVTQRSFWVRVRFLRGYDTNEILSRKKARKKMFAKPGGVRSKGVDPRLQTRTMEALDESLSDNLAKIIVDVMGVDDQFKIREFVSRMHSQDTAAIREWLRVNTPGIDNTVAIACPECELEFTVELPITESFFRPSKS